MSSADENNGIKYDPIEEDLRRVNPKAFALNITEAKLIHKASLAEWGVLRDYIDLEESETQKPEIQNAIKNRIHDVFIINRISPVKIIEIANRVKNGLYWSYRAFKFDSTADGGETKITYKVKSNIDGIIKEFDNLSLKAFFATQDMRERARLLGVPEEGLYITSHELNSLIHLESICNGRDIAQLISRSSVWYKKSSPVTDVFGEIGRLAATSPEITQGFDTLYKFRASNGVTVTIQESNFKDLSTLFSTPNADKLITQFDSKALELGCKSKSVALTLDEVMEARGVSDRKTAAEAIKAAMNLIYAVSVEMEDKATGSFKKSRILQDAVYISGKGRKSTAMITYTDAYFNHLQATTQIVQIPKKLLKIPGNKPNAYIFAKAFSLQKRRNAGKGNNIENKLAISTLLEKSMLPPYEGLKDKGQASQLIIKPFLANLDYLADELNLFSYEVQYPKRGSNSTTLTDEDLNKMFTDYSLFSSLMIAVKWTDEPDYDELKEKRKTQKAKAKRARAKKNSL